MAEQALYDYSAYQDVAKPPVGDNMMATLAGLAQEQLAAEALVASLENQLAEAKAALRAISEGRLPELMEALQLETFTTIDGVKIEVKEIIRGSIPKETEEDAFKWLEDNNEAGLIKRQFIIEFGKDEEKWANKFAADLRRRKRQLAHKIKRAVNANTLQAWVRVQLKEGVDIPLRKFGVYKQRESKITVKDK